MSKHNEVKATQHKHDLAGRRELQKKRSRLVAILGCMVVLVTALALMVPAISFTQEAAEEVGIVMDKPADATDEATESAAEPAATESEEPAAEEPAAAAEEPAADEAASNDDAQSTADEATADDGATDAAASDTEDEADNAATNDDAEGGEPSTEVSTAAIEGANASSVGAIDPNSKDAEKPAQSFKAGLKDANDVEVLTVSVEAPEGAFPAGTFMKIDGIAADKVQDKVEEAIKDASNTDDVTITNLTAVDIVFWDTDGNEIEPAKKVDVKITSNDVRNFDNPALVHVLDKSKDSSKGKKVDAEVVGKVKIVDGEGANDVDNTMKFESKAFSPYVIVEYSLATGEVSSDDADASAQTFQGEAGSIKVTAAAPEGAFPEGTTMSVESVDADEVADAVEAAISEDKSIDENSTVQQIDAVSVAFYDEAGEPVEPQETVKMSLTNANAPEEGEAVVVNIDGEGNGSTVEQTMVMTGNDKAVFNTDNASTYAMVTLETLTTQFISNNGQVYEVTVTYGPEANIPQGSTLSVTPFGEGSKDYEKARNAVLADKLAKGEYVDVNDFGLAALDISIIDPNGKEIEPAAEVNVDLKVKSLPGVDDLADVMGTMEVQHHVEAAGDKVVVETVAGGEAEASFVQATNDEVLAANRGSEVDPDSFKEEAFEALAQEQAEMNDGVETSFGTEVFSTFTITWRNGDRRVTVHYVDESGNELTIANPGNTHPNLDAGDDSPAFLIYDINGYEYSYTYRNNNNNRIAPLLTKNNYNRWQYMGADSTSTTELSNNDNIYVVYKKKAATTTGGTPTIHQDEQWPDQEDPARKPRFSKSSTNNGNGTNTISLSISAAEKPVEKTTPADVIVIFDNSGSMRYNMSGSQTSNVPEQQQRLYLAKQATNTMANTLLNGENHDVRMALISFSTDAQIEQGFTNSYGTFSGKVNALGAEGGTNWEKALMLANTLEVRSDAATFVVFVTDGDPTFRVSRGDITNATVRSDTFNSNTTYQYYRQNGVFGQGNNDTSGYNFDFAVDQVSAIAGATKNFYAIGISNSVTKVQNLTTEGGVAADHAFLASNQAAMEAAFKSITESIKSILGFGDVEITDGITEMAHVEMKVMHDVDPDSFKYYKVTSAGQVEWNPASEGVGLATYDKTSGAVKWEMGEGFQLEDGVTYMVTFRAWPSQEAYDLVADLNNGVKVYEEGQPNSITAEERAQVVEVRAPVGDVPGSYALKTNTETLNATYSQTSTTGDTVTVSGDTGLVAQYVPGTIQNMDLASELLTIRKEFDQSLDPRTVDEVVLKLQRKVNDSDHEMADYNVPGTNSPLITLGKDLNNWEYSFYVAPGFIVDGETLESGYQFTVVEPDLGENTVRYDLIPEIVNPMVVDGTLQLIGDGDNNQALTAINRTRSAVEIHKTLYDVDGTTEIYPDTEFTITGRLLGPDGTPYTSQETAAPVAYYKYDREGNPTTGREHFPTTDNISFTLKAGEFLRFVNVPEGCTFEFTEGTMPDNYEFMQLGAVGRQRAETDPAYTYSIELSDEEAHLVEGNANIKTTDEGIIGNTNYKLDFYNKRSIPLPDVELIKVDKDDNTQKLNGAEFELHKDSVDGDLVVADGNGKEISIETGNKEGSTGPDGWYHIGFLPAGTYYMVETAEPDGYVLDSTPVIITVTKGNSSYSVTATKNGQNVLSGPVEGLYTITVDNELDCTDANATKKWVNADGSTTAPEGATVEFTLYANGEATKHKVTLDGTPDATVPENAGGYESPAWTAKFVNLPKYQPGGKTPITYTVAETKTYPGYNASTTAPVASGETITNTQEPTTANAKKAWENADGTTEPPEGATVVFTLYADGEATKYTVTLDGTADTTVPTGTAGYESEAWKAEFVNLPMYKVVDGAAVAIKYTVAETTTYPGYTPSTADPVASGETITNTQGSRDTFATKAWVNADGTTEPPTGATVVFTLYADGEATKYTVTLDGTADTEPTTTGGYESEAWTAKFVKLPKYKADGTTEIVYTIAETTTYPGYEASTTDPVGSGSIITNKQVPTTANAKKEWVNADGSTTAPEGATVVFTLYADGEATKYTVTLDGTADTEPTTTGGYESEAWTAKFVKLPKYQADGTTEIKYTIAETTAYPGYTASTTDPVASGETITNTQEPTTANAKKAWKNADGSTTPPEDATVVFTLYADGEATEYAVTLSGEEGTAPEGTGGYESPAWTAKFVNLPKYKLVEGQAVEIKYTIAETTTYPGYTPSTTEQVAIGETITNTQQPTDANAKKAWKNADGSTTPPEDATVVFTLYADGEATEYAVTLSGEEGTAPEGTGGYESPAWTAKFVNLPKQKIVDGEAVDIVYTVAETTTYHGYKPSTTDPVTSGGTITNTQEDTTANAKKAWEKADGSTTAPEGATVVFTLYADGKATNYTVTLDGQPDTPVPTVTGGYESESWTATFVKLPKFQADGKTEIKYTIAETQGYDGYKASTTEPVQSGGTITNSQLSAEIKLLKIGDGNIETVLNGAEFELYTVWNGPDSPDNEKAKDCTGQEIGTITTAGGGLATIGKLLPGTYYLVETKAPGGYKLLNDAVEIYIQLIDEEPGYTVSYKQVDYAASSQAGNLKPDKDGAYQITVSDPSGSSLPVTGGSGTLPYTLCGLAIMFAAAGYIGFGSRRGRERGLRG